MHPTLPYPPENTGKIFSLRTRVNNYPPFFSSPYFAPLRHKYIFLPHFLCNFFFLPLIVSAVESSICNYCCFPPILVYYPNRIAVRAGDFEPLLSIQGLNISPHSVFRVWFFKEGRDQVLVFNISCFVVI